MKVSLPLLKIKYNLPKTIERLCTITKLVVVNLNTFGWFEERGRKRVEGEGIFTLVGTITVGRRETCN
jgi:NADH:ubiquinone oxidoreductase subunit F (NADH-binding)